MRGDGGWEIGEKRRDFCLRKFHTVSAEIMGAWRIGEPSTSSMSSAGKEGSQELDHRGDALLFAIHQRARAQSSGWDLRGPGPSNGNQLHLHPRAKQEEKIQPAEELKP